MDRTLEIVYTSPTIICLRRAFGMLALAIISAKCKREDLATLPDGFIVEAMPINQVEKMQAVIVAGDVTCIVPNPEPFTFVHYRGTFGGLRMVWGVWLERKASWRGKIEPPKKIRLDVDMGLSTDEPEEFKNA